MLLFALLLFYFHPLVTASVAAFLPFSTSAWGRSFLANMPPCHCHFFNVLLLVLCHSQPHLSFVFSVSRRGSLVRWPTTVMAKQKVTALQTLLTAKQNLLTAKQINSQQNKIYSLQKKWNELVSGFICIWNDTSCNSKSNTLLARKTAIFRAHNVLLLLWIRSR